MYNSFVTDQEGEGGIKFSVVLRVVLSCYDSTAFVSPFPVLNDHRKGSGKWVFLYPSRNNK